MTRFLTALPVYNEVTHVRNVLAEVRRYSPEILAVDDGSTDGTSAVLDSIPDLHLVRHDKNRGYGAALKSAFEYARQHDYEFVVTIDCDGQHQPQRIPKFIAAAQEADWGPTQHAGKLHDRASYRYYWELLQRARATGVTLPADCQSRFF